MIPNLFLIAAPRSGSTQLSSWLSSHPEIGIPSVKEPNIFSAHEFPEEFVASTRLNDVDPEMYVSARSRKPMQFVIFRDPAHYSYLFEKLQERWRLDASTTYLTCPEAPDLIRKYSPDARIIILTRDPVARALSHYRLAVRTGRTTRDLRTEIDAEVRGDTPLPGRFLIRPSMYAGPLKRFRKTFDESKRLELTFEEMVSDPAKALDRIAAFLNIDSSGFNIGIEDRNAGDAPRFKKLNVFILQSGLKTRLRWLLPARFIRWVKPFYFKPNDEHASASDLALLRHYLEGER